MRSSDWSSDGCSSDLGVALLRLGAVSALLFGLTLLLTLGAEVTLVAGVMLAAPLVLVAWVFFQQSPAASQGLAPGLAPQGLVPRSLAPRTAATLRDRKSTRLNSSH